MRKYIAVVGIALGIASFAFADGPTKVGYVDVDRVTAKAKAVNNMMSDIEGQVKGLQEKIDAKRKQIQSLEADLKRTEGVMAKEEQEKKRQEALHLQEELEKLEYDARQSMRRIDETVFSPILKKIVYAIQDVAKEDNFDIVLRGEAVIYGSKTVDLTDRVIEKLNLTETTGTKQKAKSAESGTPESAPKPEAAAKAPKSAEKSPAAPSSSKDGENASRKTPAVRPVDRQRD